MKVFYNMILYNNIINRLSSVKLWYIYILSLSLIAFWPEVKVQNYLSSSALIGKDGKYLFEHSKYYWIQAKKPHQGSCSVSIINDLYETKRLYFNEDMPQEIWNGSIQFLGKNGGSYLVISGIKQTLNLEVNVRELNRSYYFYRDFRFWFILTIIAFAPFIFLGLWLISMLKILNKGVKIFSKETAGLWVVIGFGISLWLMFQIVFMHVNFVEKKPYTMSFEWTGIDGYKMCQALFLTQPQDPFFLKTHDSIKDLLSTSQAIREWGSDGLNIKRITDGSGNWDLGLWVIGLRARLHERGVVGAYEEAILFAPFLQGLIYLFGWFLFHFEKRENGVGYWVVISIICNSHLGGYESIIWQMASLALVYSCVGKKRLVLYCICTITALMSLTMATAILIGLIGVFFSKTIIRNKIISTKIINLYPWVIANVCILAIITLTIAKIIEVQSSKNGITLNKFEYGLYELNKCFFIPAGILYLTSIIWLGKKGTKKFVSTWKGMSLLTVPILHVISICLWILGASFFYSGFFSQNVLWFGSIVTGCWLFLALKITQLEKKDWLCKKAKLILTMSIIGFGVMNVFPKCEFKRVAKSINSSDSPWVLLSSENKVTYFLAKSPAQFLVYFEMNGFKIAPLILDLHNGQYNLDNFLLKWGYNNLIMDPVPSPKTPNEWLKITKIQ